MEDKEMTKNERLLDAYRQFLDIKDAISMQVRLDQIAKYNWYKLHDKLDPLWLPYTLILDEHNLQIANSINQFGDYISNLQGWGNILKNKNDEYKLEIILEFIGPCATLAINMPYAIRDRFIYSIVHLCHQCNRFKDDKWVDELPEEHKIGPKQADKYCSQWEGYRKLKVALKEIANNQYAEDTKNFRHKYHHRYALGIELGKTERLKRIDKNKYGIGSTDPLTIDELLPILNNQHENCLKAFDKYQKLVNEQISLMG